MTEVVQSEHLDVVQAQVIAHDMWTAMHSGHHEASAWLGRTVSGDDDGSPARIADAIDSFVVIFDVDAKRWHSHFDASQSSIPGPEDGTDRRWGLTIGQYITRCAYESLPIGEGTVGEGSARISLRVDDDLLLTLRGAGSFETEHPYGPEEEGEIAHILNYDAHIGERPHKSV